MAGISSDQVKAFDDAIGTFKTDVDSLLSNQQALDRSNQALKAAQDDVDAKTGAVTASMATLQTDLDSVNSAAAAAGLLVRVPAPPAPAPAPEPTPAPVPPVA